MLRPEERAALRAIVQCRTAVLGGHLDVCTACGIELVTPSSAPHPHVHAIVTGGGLVDDGTR